MMIERKQRKKDINNPTNIPTYKAIAAAVFICRLLGNSIQGDHGAYIRLCHP
jgi:hypothetical protein